MRVPRQSRGITFCIYGIQGRSTVLTWLRKLGCRAWSRPKKKAYCQGARRLQKQKGLSLSRACELLGITQQAVYQREKRIEHRAIELVPVKTMVMDARRFMPRLGARKLYFLLKPRFEEQGIKLGRDDFIDYLRDHQLLVKPVKRYTKTTHSKHWMKKYPNRFESLNHLC